MLKKVRFVLWGLVLCALLFIGWLFLQKHRQLNTSEPPIAAAGVPIVAAFELIDQKGRVRSEKDFRHKYMLIYFGYSYCPDICPTGLQNITEALTLLGPVADKIQPIFITVDPNRDTQEQLATYMENFHPKFLALTGDTEKIDAAKKAFHVYAATYHGKGETETLNYLVDHSSLVYLIGPGGKYLTHFTHATSPEDMAKTIREILYS